MKYYLRMEVVEWKSKQNGKIEWKVTLEWKNRMEVKIRMEWQTAMDDPTGLP